ncbi:MAG: cation transporter [Bacteroidetes bacterium]|nr:cation transporter [Bacteroidota bacterium]
MFSKTAAARISVISNTSLVIIKFVAGFVSGSVSVISEAIHSMMDLLAAVIAFFSVKVSDTPADERHPYGHGKYENVSGVIEALLIFVAAIWIIYEAIDKLIHPRPLEKAGIGMIVMFVSAIINFFVSQNLYKVARRTESIALEADALHLKTDVYTSLGVAIGLLLIYISGIQIIDPIAAILVACLILKESYNLLKRAYSPLLDEAISNDELMDIEASIKKSNYPFHDLKSRQSGNMRFIEFHMEMPGDMPLKEVHKICDDIEEDIKNKIPNIQINIHVETHEAIIADN